jgi:hypothetical protein
VSSSRGADSRSRSYCSSEHNPLTSVTALPCRLQHLKEHEATVSMIDIWDLMAPLWNCDGPLERVGWFLDGGAVLH